MFEYRPAHGWIGLPVEHLGRFCKSVQWTTRLRPDSLEEIEDYIYTTNVCRAGGEFTPKDCSIADDV